MVSPTVTFRPWHWSPGPFSNNGKTRARPRETQTAGTLCRGKAQRDSAALPGSQMSFLGKRFRFVSKSGNPKIPGNDNHLHVFFCNSKKPLDFRAPNSETYRPHIGHRCRTYSLCMFVHLAPSTAATKELHHQPETERRFNTTVDIHWLPRYRRLLMNGVIYCLWHRVGAQLQAWTYISQSKNSQCGTWTLSSPQHPYPWLLWLHNAALVRKNDRSGLSVPHSPLSQTDDFNKSYLPFGQPETIENPPTFTTQRSAETPPSLSHPKSRAELTCGMLLQRIWNLGGRGVNESWGRKNE